MAKNREIEIFCPTHNKPETIVRNSPLLCERGVEMLEEFPPRQQIVFFCCLCSVFLTIDSFFNKNKDGWECRSCLSKKINAFYLCAKCWTIAFDNSVSGRVPYSYLIKDGVLNKACPACFEDNANVIPAKHNCEFLKLPLHTSREICPFCINQIPQDKLVIEPLKIFNEKISRHEKAIDMLQSQIHAYQERLKHLDNLPLRQVKTEESLDSLEKRYEALEQKYADLKVKNIGEIEKLEDRLTAIERQFNYHCHIFSNQNKKLGAFFGNFKEEISRHLNQINSIIETVETSSDSKTATENVAGNSTEINQVNEKNLIAGNTKPIEKPEYKSFQSEPTEKDEISHLPSITKHANRNSFTENDEFLTVPSANVLPYLSSADEPNELNLPRSVTDILKQFTEKAPLYHYPGMDKALVSSASADGTVIFFRLQIKEKIFAIPASGNVQNESQFKQYASFYTAQTSRLNGKITIDAAAEISWDESIKGYRLRQKGIISIT